jgi:hypothetical protein
MPKPLTTAQITRLLKFKVEWIKDPPPPFRQYLDAAALKQIAQAKVDFGKQINQIVADGIARR